MAADLLLIALLDAGGARHGRVVVSGNRCRFHLDLERLDREGLADNLALLASAVRELPEVATTADLADLFETSVLRQWDRAIKAAKSAVQHARRR